MKKIEEYLTLGFIVLSISCCINFGYGQVNIERQKIDYELINKKKKITLTVEKKADSNEELYYGIICNDTNLRNCVLSLRKNSINNWDINVSGNWKTFYTENGLVDSISLLNGVGIKKIDDFVFMTNKISKFYFSSVGKSTSPPTYYFSPNLGIVVIKTSMGFYIRKDLIDEWTGIIRY
ncbi:hypothetical protein [Fluviicola sp.]|uniref:hypothetical protein n=1 Tax=Fluviicola sp. TaxID=1917219 RepID=UPI0026309D31|nr:hypothetical protein [Fluviicola sp.]